MKAQVQTIQTASTNKIEKVLIITINPFNVTNKVKTFFHKVNATMEGLGSAAAFAIRN